MELFWPELQCIHCAWEITACKGTNAVYQHKRFHDGICKHVGSTVFRAVTETVCSRFLVVEFPRRPTVFTISAPQFSELLLKKFCPVTADRFFLLEFHGVCETAAPGCHEVSETVAPGLGELCQAGLEENVSG